MADTEDPDEDEAVVAHAMRDGCVPIDFEHRRIFAAVNKRLFDTGKLLCIGRFPVLRRLGSGGMGEVYLCEDEELGRNVAVKWVLGGGTTQAQLSLREEARSLARISHHNVVPVHEVGEHEGRTFLVMEYIEGQTLRAWLDARHGSRAEVVRNFVAAGRGLSAVHRAGFVHRDFKPENVLLDRNGWVRITDFGLAIESAPPKRDDVDSRDDLPSDQMIATEDEAGGILGTHAYMPLEQLRGKHVDARSDMFAFCMALYEGLWGEPPFAAGTLREREVALERGIAKVPSDMRAQFRVIRRGLEREPSERWPNMDVLLDAIEAIPRRHRRRRAVAAITLGLCVVLGLAWWFSTPSASTCERQLTDVWDADVRERLASHVETFEISHAADSWSRVHGHLDQWAAAWEVERTSVCDELEQTRDALRLASANSRNTCLERQSRRVASLVEALADGDADVLAQAVTAVGDIPDPAECAGPLALKGIDPPPARLSEVVEVLRSRLGSAHELRLLGRSRAALIIASSTEADATMLGYVPLIAEARGELAKAEVLAGSSGRAAELYDSAIALAVRQNHALLEADLRVHRAELSLSERTELAQVELRLDEAASAIEAAGSNKRLQVRLALSRGHMANLVGDDGTAVLEYRTALELTGDDSLETPAVLDALAGVTMNPDQALALRGRALATARSRFGDRHPRTAMHWYNYGSALQTAGKGGELEKETAAKIWAETGEDTRKPWLAKREILLGEQALQRGEPQVAERHAREAVALLAVSRPLEHPDQGEPEQLLATIEATRGSHELAIEHARTALARFEAGPDDPRVASMQLLLGNQLLELERFDAAVEVLTPVLASGRASPRDVAIAHSRLAEIAVRREQWSEADLELQIAARGRDLLGSEAPCFELLRAVVDLRRDRQLTPVQQQRLAQARAKYPRMNAQLSLWLVDLGVSAEHRHLLGL